MKITVYTKNDCRPCWATKRTLTAAGVEFVEVNVDEVPSARDYLIGRGFRESPVVEVATERPGVSKVESWSGFRPDRLADLIAAVGA